MSVSLLRLASQPSPSSCLRVLLHRSYAFTATASNPAQEFLQAGLTSRLSSAEVDDSQSQPLAKGKAKRTRKTDTKAPKSKNIKSDEGDSVPRRNLLEQSKIEDYLDFVASTKHSVTLADVERCRPPTHGRPGTPEYEADYTTLLDTLVRSFSQAQLRRFLKLYNVSPPPRPTKWTLAVAIMEKQWNWPSLTKIQRDHRDWTEVTTESR